MAIDSVVTIRQLQRIELLPAALILSRAMRDNPMHVRTFTIADAERRRRALERFFRPVLLGVHNRGVIYGAHRNGVLVGICGVARPDFCQPTTCEKLRVLPAVLLRNPFGVGASCSELDRCMGASRSGWASLASGAGGHRT